MLISAFTGLKHTTYVAIQILKYIFKHAGKYLVTYRIQLNTFTYHITHILQSTNTVIDILYLTEAEELLRVAAEKLKEVVYEEGRKTLPEDGANQSDL